ncbi:MAG TPA: FtsQ-type POTRA domain-containing protein [Acidobacteriaceae bacterium]|nr:FtsQ-type POTRA domain-containing protein [Acidobacteriaceae bacterium]
MQTFTGRGKRAALLDVEGPGDSFSLETFAIPQPILDETTDEEVTEAGSGESFLRSRERVSGRRRSRVRSAWKSRSVQIAGVLAALASLGLLYAAIRETQTVLRHNPRFMLMSLQSVQVNGNRVVSRNQALACFASDVGHSIFRIPLAARQAQLRRIDWVRSAAVMRIWPNQLRVSIVERTPVAFARDGDSVRLVDADGVLLDMKGSAAQKYSFPVLSGISALESSATRAYRMQTYRRFAEALDTDGHHLSEVSEVDLSDPEDLRAVFSGASSGPIVHLGDSNFAPRYRAYQTHIKQWLHDYPNLRSVDMRYGTQVVLDTGTQPAPAKSGSNLGAHAPPSVAAAAGDGKVHGRPAQPVSSKRGHPATRSTAKRPNRAHKHRPERGHIVRDPIAHPISGA